MGSSYPDSQPSSSYSTVLGMQGALAAERVSGLGDRIRDGGRPTTRRSGGRAHAG